MADRKPEGVTFTSWIEESIQAAQRSGEFDNLPGEGKPLSDADEPYHESWWVQRWAAREGVSITPDLLRLRKEIQDFRENLDRMTEIEVRDRLSRLNGELAEANVRELSSTLPHLPPLDVDDTLQSWRKMKR